MYMHMYMYMVYMRMYMYMVYMRMYMHMYLPFYVLRPCGTRVLMSIDTQ